MQRQDHDAGVQDGGASRSDANTQGGASRHDAYADAQDSRPGRNGVAAPSGGPGGRALWGILLLGAALLPVLLGIAVMAKGMMAGAPQSVAVRGGGPTSAAGQGVHVCTVGHYNAGEVLCSRDDGTISYRAYATAELVVVAGAGQTFTTSSLTMVVSKKSGSGRWVSQGTTSVEVGGSAVSAAQRLQDILALATSRTSLTPSDAGTYRISVAEGTTPLGAATFTLAP